MRSFSGGCLTRKVSFTVESRKPARSERCVYCIATAKPVKEGKGKAKKPDWKDWQATIRHWAGPRGQELLEMTDDAFRRVVEGGTFDASKGSTVLLPAGDQAWLLVVGLGDGSRLEARSLVSASAVAARRAGSLKDHRMVSLLHEAPIPDVEEGERMEAVVQGILLGSYKFERYRSKGDEDKSASPRKRNRSSGSKPKQEQLDVSLLAESKLARKMRPRVESARIAAQGQLLARDLANTPGNVATPEYLSKEARRIAREAGLTCKVMGVQELKQRKMAGILAVGQGSENPPRLIVLRHTPKRNRARTFRRVVVVGKGITFDTGGISIKPSDRLELMKYDKSGACAVIGLMWAVAKAKLDIEVIGLAACAENMPSGTAYRPGDILTMMNGKTVEVLNTDAEGRMVLADALHYAGEFKPDAVIDVATLTGAIDVALGGHYSGLMGTDKELLSLLEEAGHGSGERVWRMPLGEEYQEQIKGHHSDLVNIGGRSGGALTAGQFLSNFAPDGAAWAHLDIAGTAWDDKDRAENRKGASGVGVRLLYRFLNDML